jgi:hypothetical protein
MVSTAETRATIDREAKARPSARMAASGVVNRYTFFTGQV